MLNPLIIGLLNFDLTEGDMLLTISSLKATFLASIEGVIFMLKITIFEMFFKVA
jgi:hypothetical protein